MSSNFTTNLSLVNASQLADHTATRVMASFIGTISVLGTAANLLILTVFACDVQARASFTFYILNLILANLFSTIIEMPFTTHYSFFGGSTWSYPVCTLFLYIDWLASAASLNAVMMVSLNRMWSTLGHHRRQSNSSALMICGLMWIYLNMVLIPFVLAERLYGDPNSDCVASFSNPNFALALEVLFFIIPICVIFLSYGIACWKLSGRKTGFRTGPKIIPAFAEMSPIFHITLGNNTQDTTNCLSKEQQSLSIEVSGRMTRYLRSIHLPSQLKQERHWTKALLLLASVAICSWTPATIFYAVIIADEKYFSLISYAVLMCIQYSNALLNPLIYYLSIPEIRRAVLKIFKKQPV